MYIMPFIRGSNPIWLLDDLVGNLFDDTFYMFVLENDLPYLPSPVYHTPSGTPWTNPIRFLANGTLPVDIFFDSTLVYRLEFRQGPTQAAPLIYLVENYLPGNSGNTPITSVALITDNQITNPQFSLIDFASPFTITSGGTQTIDVAPGWFLDLTGTGNVTLTQVPLNNSAGTVNPTNAPYALQITLSGTWSVVHLRQRFEQNGMLWANKVVSSSVTARIEGAPQNISATIVDSNGTVLTTVLSSTSVNSIFTEYLGFGQLPATTNPDLPPVAYVDYIMALPTAVDIYLTSFQLVVQNLLTNIGYEQDSIERQVDHTFHYYRDSIILKPKASILTGWNFPLNPWQFRTPASSPITASQYTADQTIVSLQNINSLEAQAGANNRYFGIQSVTSAAQGKFALIQYIDTFDIQPYWGNIVSSLVRAGISTAHSTGLRVKMRLIHRATVPPAVDPISSWAATDPTFTAGWTAVAPLIDNVFTIDTLALKTFSFDGFQLPAASASTKYLGIVLYTVNTLNSAAVADLVYFDKISLVPNEFGIESPPQTYEQVLRNCFFHYEKSYAANVLPGTVNAGGPLLSNQLGVNSGGNNSVILRSFGWPFKNIKRSVAPLVQTYSPTSGVAAAVRAFLRNNGASVADADVSLANWTETFFSSPGVSYATNTIAAQLTTAGANSFPEGYILYHYTVDARLGLIA